MPPSCRGESLSRLGHLSSDGMMRPWLPTYSSLAQQAAAGARAAAAGAGASAGGGTGEMCYVEVQPIPKYRTLLKVAAGRMLRTAPAGGGGAGSGWGFAEASVELLRSLEALSLLGESSEEEEEDIEQAAAGSSSCTSASSSGGAPAVAPPAGTAAAAAAAQAGPAPVQYRTDSARGTLRLLQAIKEPHLFKLVWHADRAPPADAAAGPAAPAGSAGNPQQQQLRESEPFDMFGSAAASSTPASSSSSASSASAALLGYMPTATAAASAARGPLLQEGCELWEGAAEHDWELALPTEATTSDAAVDELAATQLPASVEPRQLPNGAQLLMVTPAGGGRRRGGRYQPAPAAFWLQQRLGADSLQLPAYAMVEPAAPGAAAPAAPAAAPAPEQAAASSQEGVDERQGAAELAAEQPLAEQQLAEQPAEEQGAAALLAAALLRMLRHPPGVDLRRLRKDVKSGAIQVWPRCLHQLAAAAAWHMRRCAARPGEL